MAWFILTLACIILWGVTDILYKAASNQNDRLAHCKTFVWIGIVMALTGGIMSTWSDTLLDSFRAVKGDMLYLVPLCLVYAVALFFGLLGKMHLDASVVSSLENVDGAMAALIIYFYYLLTGYIHPLYDVGVMEVAATVSIIIGVLLLGSHEQARMKQEAHLSEDKKKNRFGALALFFPIIYNLADVLSVAEISGVVSEGEETFIPAIDFFIFECAGFALVAICVWFYMLIVKKYAYNPFHEEELLRCGAATGETFGTMTFIFAAGINPTLTAPITSSYCLVTIVLARIFLKERLSKKQYVSLAFLIAGIALLGISEIFNV